MRGQNDPEIPVERRTSPHIATTPAASSYSRVGIASFLCACVFLLVFFAFILEAVGSSYNIYKDNALESLIGIGAFILLIGFLLGIAGIIQSIFQAKKMLFAVLGLILNALLYVFYAMIMAGVFAGP